MKTLPFMVPTFEITLFRSCIFQRMQYRNSAPPLPAHEPLVGSQKDLKAGQIEATTCGKSNYLDFSKT